MALVLQTSQRTNIECPNLSVLEFYLFFVEKGRRKRSMCDYSVDWEVTTYMYMYVSLMPSNYVNYSRRTVTM